MKKLFVFLGTSLMALSLISAVPNMTKCGCRNCTCTQEKHCGCLSQSDNNQNGENYSCHKGCSCDLESNKSEEQLTISQ